MTDYDLSEWPLFRSVIDAGQTPAVKPRTCFVAAPRAGAPESVRRHAEIVWKYIVRPALLDTEYAPFRPEVGGDLDQQVFDALLNADLVVAIASFQDPAVFYQIAAAQSASRPLILLVEEGEDLPFPPRGALVVRYSIDTDAVFSSINVRKLTAAVRDHEAGKAPPAEGFRSGGAFELAGAQIFERSAEFPYDRRLAMMRDAEQRIDIMGLANGALARHPDMIELIRSRAGQEVQIRILQCAPANPTVATLFGLRDTNRLGAIRDEIEKASENWRRIIEQAGEGVAISVRRTQHALPLANAILTEKGVVATPYLYSQPTNESPTFVAGAGAQFHAIMQDEFNTLWNEGATFVRSEPQARPAPSLPPAPPANANGVREMPLSQNDGSGGLGPLRGLRHSGER